MGSASRFGGVACLYGVCRGRRETPYTIEVVWDTDTQQQHFFFSNLFVNGTQLFAFPFRDVPMAKG